MASAGAVLIPAALHAVPGPVKKSKKSLRVAHITDVHIRPEHNAPARFRKCLQDIKARKVDFFLNGGDTIYAADYSHIKRERVDEQWTIWQKLRKEIAQYEIHSCLGNHDMWWAAPSKKDPMYGKDFAVKQLKIPGKWHLYRSKPKTHANLDENE